MELLCQKKKRAKITDRYPPLALSDVSDEATNSRNKEALDKELSKKKPKKVNDTRVDGAHVWLPESLYC